MTLAQANRGARHWCRYENGLTEHGTTGEKPYERFMAHEYKALLPLPEVEFELADWKKQPPKKTGRLPVKMS